MFGKIIFIANGNMNRVNDQVRSFFKLKKSEFDTHVDKLSVLKTENYLSIMINLICWFGIGMLLGVVTLHLES